MSHGYPDWGISAPKASIYALNDMAELAARLGSIHTFDRRGNVVWFDDFEGPTLRWTLLGSGAGATAALTTETSNTGAQCAKLTTGSDAGGWVYISKTLHLPPLSEIGVEIAFTTPAEMRFYQLILRVHTGSRLLQTYASVDVENLTLSIQNETGGATVIDALVSPYQHLYTFHKLKLVVNYPLEKYARLLLDNRCYDLSARNIYAYNNTAAPYLYARIRGHGVLGANRDFHVDDVIITQNEP